MANVQLNVVNGVNGVKGDEMTKDNHNSIFMRNIQRRFRESEARS